MTGYIFQKFVYSLHYPNGSDTKTLFSILFPNSYLLKSGSKEQSSVTSEFVWKQGTQRFKSPFCTCLSFILSTSSVACNYRWFFMLKRSIFKTVTNARMIHGIALNVPLSGFNLCLMHHCKPLNIANL